uniref:Uncharacterized protein n=1 Tax=Anguilla anguilla TaxID=7936 RepID=A0A0E9Q5Z0_ANGAN
MSCKTKMPDPARTKHCTTQGLNASFRFLRFLSRYQPLNVLPQQNVKLLKK